MRVLRRLLSVACVGSCVALAACGSRTGLLVPDVTDAAPPAAPPNAPPPAPAYCDDAGASLVYVITQQNVLLTFYPPTAQLTTIGTLACPTDPSSAPAPFSMAVDHTGIAYVAFDDGEIFRVSARDASCTATARVLSPGVFQNQFGMGFAANLGAGDAGGAVETLYLAGNPGGTTGAAPIVLGVMDTSTFSASTVGVVTPSIYGSELTGTGGGKLFGFYQTSPGGSAAAIGEIDKTTGDLIAPVDLPGVDITGGWAFAFWGGDFYTFTAPDGVDTVVQRFRPSDGSVVQVATTPGLTVVGAGVSTCAPQG